MACAVLGPRGTFSEEAACGYWGKRDDMVVAATISQVFALVGSGAVEEALVPLENSLAGSIKETIQCLQESRIRIRGEMNLTIRQDLMACKQYSLDEIEWLITQPIALLQCQAFIARHLSAVRTEICASTSRAAAMLRQETRKAVSIGNSQTAMIYGLKIICPDIAGEDNVTRFIHIAREKGETKGDKSSIIFSLADRAGALYEVLGIFARRNLNLSKIESYPGRNARAGYNFYIEADTPAGEDLQPVLEEMEPLCRYIKYLGSYLKALPTEADGKLEVKNDYLF
ncbi:prephenate dehydratase [Syntrophomonas curvata]